MSESVYPLIFSCSGEAARRPMAEVLLKRRSKDWIRAGRAGSCLATVLLVKPERLPCDQKRRGITLESMLGAST